MSEIPTWDKISNANSSTTTEFGGLWGNLISDYYNGTNLALIDPTKIPIFGTLTRFKFEKLGLFDIDQSHYILFSADDIDTGPVRKIKFRRMNTPFEEDYAVLEGLPQQIYNKIIDGDLNTISNITGSSIKTGAAIPYSKLSLNNSIVNADVNSSAAIVTTKLADSANFLLKTLDNSFGAHYYDITKMTVPGNPSTNDIRIYVDTADTHLKIRNNAGTVVDLHSVGGATNLNALTDVDTVTAAPTDNQVLTYSTGSSQWIPATPPGAGGGESNTASNLGAGTGIWASKVGADLKFKSLLQGSNITISNTANDITIAAAGSVTPSSTDAFTNKTFNADATGNVITNIENADIKAAAGIVYSKLSLNNSIVNADIASGAAIVTTKLADNTNFILKTLDNSFGAHFQDITKITAPGNPGANDIRLYVDTADTHLKIRNNAGTVVDLHNTAASIAPATASYVTLGANPTLTSERILAAGVGLTLTDSGANNPVTLAINPTGSISKITLCETDFVENRSNAIFDDWPSGTGAGVFNDSSESNALGVWTVTTGTTTTGRMALISDEKAFKTGGAILTFIERIRIPVLSTITERFIVRTGFGTNVDTESTDGAYFEYDESTSANWRMVTANNSTRTKATSGTAVPLDTWVWLKIIINAAGTSVSFYVNGTEVTNSPITTNLPTIATRPFGSLLQIVKSAGITTRDADVDYIGLFGEYTSNRGTF